jgi:hypothetical protein
MSANPEDFDFEKLNDDPDLTQEKVQDMLNGYAQAFREEFEEKTKKAPENVIEYTQDFFKKNINAAAAQIVWLTTNSTSDAIRLAASKYVIEQASKDAKADGDPIKQMLKQLTKGKA